MPLKMRMSPIGFMEVLSAKIQSLPELVNILHNIEMPVARVLTGMEER